MFVLCFTGRPSVGQDPGADGAKRKRVQEGGTFTNINLSGNGTNGANGAISSHGFFRGFLALRFSCPFLKLLEKRARKLLAKVFLPLLVAGFLALFWGQKDS